MAGSYNSTIDNDGNLLGNDEFVKKIENLGDAYEMAEEMYGMIWWLAHMAPDAAPAMTPDDLVRM
ncbi:MAG TPA: hypothetical protein VN843_04405, partial [Anaerolineales bacterium]|nr:hypothetical protein [Anaerolineales bacterium]